MTAIMAVPLLACLTAGTLHAQGHLSTQAAGAWPRQLAGIAAELDQPIAIYLGESLGVAPRFEYTNLTPDLRFLTVAAHLKGRYVRDTHFHVIAPDLNSASEPQRSAEALVKFVDSLTPDQFEELFTTGIEVRELTMDQLFHCLPLFRSEEQMESVLNGDRHCMITIRPTLSVKPAGEIENDPRLSFYRYLIDPMSLHSLSTLHLADEDGKFPHRLPEWNPPTLTPVVPLGRALEIQNLMTTLGGLVDYLSQTFNVHLKVDPRLRSHAVYVHGTFDRESAIRLVSHLADVEVPGVKVREELERRIDALHDKAFEHWGQISDQSKVELTEEELTMFFEQKIISAAQLDGGSGRFVEIFELGKISIQGDVQLQFELDWHISSMGSYPALDENREPRTLRSGYRFVISNNFNQLISRHNWRH